MAETPRQELERLRRSHETPRQELERLRLEQRRQRKPRPTFGKEDILPSLARGATTTLGMIGDLQSMLPRGLSLLPGSAGLPTTQQIRSDVDRLVDKAGGDEAESVFTGGEDTARGRALEFAGSSLTFGVPSLTSKLMVEGAKSFAKATARNFAGSSLAGASSYAGERIAGTPGALVGAFVPAAVGAGVKGAVKGTLRGVGRQKQIEMKNALMADEVQGAQSTLGSTANVPRAAVIQRSFESVPGGHGPSLRNAEKNSQMLQRRFESFLGNKGYAEETAGGYIGGAVKRQLDAFRRESRRLYDNAEQLISNRNAIVPVRRTLDTVKKMAAQEDEQFAALLNSVKAQDDVSARMLAQMARPGRIDKKTLTGELGAELTAMGWYHANNLRRVVGQQISLAKSIGDPSQGVLKQIYKALAKDVQAGAKLAGGKKAQKAFNFANAYWRRNRAKVDRMIDPMLKRNIQPELLFREVVGTALNKPTKLRLVLEGLKGPQKEYVAKAFVSRLGNIDDSTGRIVDQLWSPGRLLRNWSKIGSKQKDELFKGPELEKLRRAIDRYMKVLDRQAKSSAILANPSGTAGTGLAAATLQSALAGVGKLATFGLGGSVAFGSITGGLATIGVSMAGANVGAILMNSPQFLNWLTKASASPIKELPRHIARLNNLANDDPEFVQALDAFNTALALELQKQRTE